MIENFPVTRRDSKSKKTAFSAKNPLQKLGKLRNFSTVTPSCLNSKQKHFWSPFRPLQLFLRQFETAGHCKLKCNFSNLKVYSDEFVTGTMIIFSSKFWQQVKANH